jgi:hypothetical protein
MWRPLLPGGAWNHRIVCAPFEGQFFSSIRLGPFEGLAYVIRSQAVLMPPVVAAPFQAAQSRAERVTWGWT